MTDAETSVFGMTLHQAVRHLARHGNTLTGERDRARALTARLMDELTSDGHFTERLCPHGIGHPDPDDTRAAKRIHGCDGCCTHPQETA